jgi:hypothetical protein
VLVVGLGIDGSGRRSLGVIRRGGAGGAAAGANVPDLELLKAVVAGARGRGARVEVGILVQGHGRGRVRVAEDVATSPAMVASVEVVERALADGVVADRGLGVRLPVLAGGQVGDFGKEVEIQLAVKALATVTSRPAGEAVADAAQAGDGDQAVAGAAGGEAAAGLHVATATVVVVVVAAAGGRWLDGSARGLKVAVGAQDGGHVHGTAVTGVVRLGRGRRRVVGVAEVRCAERRDLGSGRDLVGLGATVVHAGAVLGDEVTRELLVPRQDRHNQVGGHGEKMSGSVVCEVFRSRERLVVVRRIYVLYPVRGGGGGSGGGRVEE